MTSSGSSCRCVCVSYSSSWTSCTAQRKSLSGHRRRRHRHSAWPPASPCASASRELRAPSLVLRAPGRRPLGGQRRPGPDGQRRPGPDGAASSRAGARVRHLGNAPRGTRGASVNTVCKARPCGSAAAVAPLAQEISRYICSLRNWRSSSAARTLMARRLKRRRARCFLRQRHAAIGHAIADGSGFHSCRLRRCRTNVALHSPRFPESHGRRRSPCCTSPQSPSSNEGAATPASGAAPRTDS